MQRFMQECFSNAVELKKKFIITENKKWTPLIVADELNVQIGHLAYIISGNNFSAENGRNISNKADELSDVLLQLCALCAKLNISKKEITNFNYNYISEKICILDIVSLSGQITETLMELEEFRHDKPRCGFNSKLDFITDRISKIFSLVFAIANHNNIDMVESFKIMYKDATNFLEKFKEVHSNV